EGAVALGRAGRGGVAVAAGLVPLVAGGVGALDAPPEGHRVRVGGGVRGDGLAAADGEPDGRPRLREGAGGGGAGVRRGAGGGGRGRRAGDRRRCGRLSGGGSGGAAAGGGAP